MSNYILPNNSGIRMKEGSYIVPEAIAKLPLWPHLFMAVFGAGWAIGFDFGFRLYGAEILAILGLVIVNWWSPLQKYHMARRVIGAYLLWMLAIIVADNFNSTSIYDSARNIASPILGTTSLLFALTVLSRNPHALLSFLAAIVLAKGVLGEPQYGESFANYSMGIAAIQQDTNYFKVRIDPFLTPAVLLMAYWMGKKSLKYAASILIIVSIAYLALDDRSIGLLLFLTGMALLGLHFRLQRSFSRFAISVAIAVFAGYAAYMTYVSYTINFNPSGHNAKQLWEMENPYNPLELLSRGRSEWMVIPDAIAERPIFGWGSWAIDVQNQFTSTRDGRLSKFGYTPSNQAEVWGYIPVHSVVGAAWVWSGILGFIAIVWLLRNILIMASKIAYIKSPLLPLVTFYSMLMIWHLFFSPPQQVRISFPISLASLIILTNEVLSASRRLPTSARKTSRLQGSHFQVR